MRGKTLQPSFCSAHTLLLFFFGFFSSPHPQSLEAPIYYDLRFIPLCHALADAADGKLKPERPDVRDCLARLARRHKSTGKRARQGLFFLLVGRNEALRRGAASRSGSVGFNVLQKRGREAAGGGDVEGKNMQTKRCANKAAESKLDS